MFWFKCLIWKARMWLLRRASKKELMRICRASYRRLKEKPPKITLTCGDGYVVSPQLGNRRPTAELMAHLLATGKVVLDDAFDNMVLNKLGKTPLDKTWTQLAIEARGRTMVYEEWEASIEESRRLADELALLPPKEACVPVKHTDEFGVTWVKVGHDWINEIEFNQQIEGDKK